MPGSGGGGGAEGNGEPIPLLSRGRGKFWEIFSQIRKENRLEKGKVKEEESDNLPTVCVEI